MKKILLIVAFFAITLQASAQIILGVANYKYKNLNYSGAIPFYEHYFRKGRHQDNIQTLRKLAKSYQLTNRTDLAEKLYGSLTQKDTVWNDDLMYVEMMMRNKNYDNAFKYINTEAVVNRKDYRIEKIRNSLKTINELMTEDTANVRIKSMSFNSLYSDFSPVFFDDGIVFATNRTRSTFVSRNHSWTSEILTSLNYVDLTKRKLKPKKFAREIRGFYNYGPATFNSNFSKIYYTENTPKANKKNGYRNLRIESAYFDYSKNKWIKNNVFYFNNQEYACAHPSLSADSTKLYFSSNMPGGFGGMDIYMCKWVDTTWSTPINLGAGVNSPGEEVFPYIYKDSILYYSSDGRGGLGGLDIFSLDLKNKSAEGLNLGAPMNSFADDFGIVRDAKKEKGFFTSDRGNYGIDDDIYSFERIKPKGKIVNIFIVDKQNGKLIDSVDLTIKSDALSNPMSVYLKDGSYIGFPVSIAKLYAFSASVPNYTPAGISVVVNKNDTAYYIKMNKLLKGCIVQGKITNKQTGEPLDSALITITNITNNQEVFSTYTDATGFYRFTGLEGNKEYRFNVSKKQYFAKEQTLSTAKNNCVYNNERPYDYLKDIQLEQIIIGKAIKIENIYFDLNKFNIRPDAAIELDKIVKVMEQNPEIIIEVGSHTDARGSDKSNFTLSDNRAKSSAAYIVSRGIDEKRITGKGYGETMLVNKCGNNVKCSEKQHQQNRRTEFKVVGFLGQ